MPRLAGFHPVNGKPIYATVTTEERSQQPKAEPEPEPTVIVHKTVAADVSDKGEVTARICTFGVVDLDLDVVNAGSFGKTPQEVVSSAWNHGSYGQGHGALPVGVGIVRAEGKYGVFRGRLLLETQAGRDTNEVLQALGGRCQWSWGFLVTHSHRGTQGGKPVRFIDRVMVEEVSPVIRAASIGTGTTELRGSDAQQLELQRMARELERAPVEDLVRAKRAKRIHDSTLAVEIERARALGVRV